MRRPLLTLLALVACAACTGSDGPGRAGFRVDTVAGVPHAVNEGRPPAWTLERERVVGILGAAGDEPSPEEFASIRWLALDGRGNLYVADNGVRQIQVFDTAGAHLRTIGRRGSGPGEFMGIQAMAFLGDTLLVEDPGNGRMALLSRTGEHLGEWPMTRMSGRADWFHTLATDTVAMLDMRRGEAGIQRVYTLLTAAGPVDTIPRPAPADRDIVGGLDCDTNDGRILLWTDPLAPAPITAPAPGRLIVQAWSDAYRLPFLNAAGDTVLVVARPDLELAVPDSMRARIDREYDAWRGDMPFGASCNPASGRAGYDILPPLEHIAFDVDGRMWVETLTGEGRAWEVFSPEGRLLGRAPVPARHEVVPPAIRNGRMAVVEEAPEGYQRVVVYRLVEGG